MDEAAWVNTPLEPMQPSKRSNHDWRWVEVETKDAAGAFARVKAAIQAYDIYAPDFIGSTICGDLQVGATVIQHITVGKRTVSAANRVTAIRDEPNHYSLEVATIPGHPERGVISFEVNRQGPRVTFTMRAWSEPASWSARLLKFYTRRLQVRAWDGALERMHRRLLQG